MRVQTVIEEVSTPLGPGTGGTSLRTGGYHDVMEIKRLGVHY